jgi:hypothetical protein
MLGKKRKPESSFNKTSSTDDEPVGLDTLYLSKLAAENKTEKRNILNKKEEGVKKVLIKDDEKEIFADIDDIVESFMETFNEITKEEILTCLKMNSFNIVNTYLYLKDPQHFNSK